MFMWEAAQSPGFDFTVTSGTGFKQEQSLWLHGGKVGNTPNWVEMKSSAASEAEHCWVWCCRSRTPLLGSYLQDKQRQTAEMNVILKAVFCSPARSWTTNSSLLSFPHSRASSRYCRSVANIYSFPLIKLTLKIKKRHEDESTGMVALGLGCWKLTNRRDEQLCFFLLFH